MRTALAALALLAASCYTGPSRYYQPPPPSRPAPPPPPAPDPQPPPPAGPRMLTEQEAVNVAVGHARANGLSVRRVKHAHLDGAGRWHVELRGDHGHDKAKMLVDGWTGQVLRARLKDEDRDWED